jgi:hypothetical protein
MRYLLGFAALLQELGHKTGPSSLVTGADTRTGIAVEVLVKED